MSHRILALLSGVLLTIGGIPAEERCPNGLEKQRSTGGDLDLLGSAVATGENSALHGGTFTLRSPDAIGDAARGPCDCLCDGIFSDGFESGDTRFWDADGKEKSETTKRGEP